MVFSIRSVFLILIIVTLAPIAHAQRLVEWTEAAGELGLGYPVPIPVDTPLPFDGFRTYAGLHARHQDLDLSHGIVSGSIVGQTTSGRDIWAYQMGDGDNLTIFGTPESAAMIQGGIHSREWQSPETSTGLMEWLVDHQNDEYLHDYLLDNVNLVVLPVLNIDGFMQTQRFPRQNYLDADPTSSSSPRDGRMRRKNMRGVDENILTTGDLLFGIDLNRNNPPFWATSGRSSSDNRSLVHHGSSPHSESETQAMRFAADNLALADRLRIYTDLHSFGQVFFSVNTGNSRTFGTQTRLLADISNHHVTLPGTKRYFDQPAPPGGGIGSTDEFFGETYQIPSWTLEIEPSGGSHPGLPGVGADYGGFATNGHDGFILPESQIRRVRENLAQSLIVGYYHQAGPPALLAVRYLDPITGAVLIDAEWDVKSDQTRQLSLNVVQPILAERDYDVWLAFDKPMRWLDDQGDAVPLPGQSNATTRISMELVNGIDVVNNESSDPRWLTNEARRGVGYFNYATDAWTKRVSYDAAEIAAADAVTVDAFASDMVGQNIDSDPSTIIDWVDGVWVNYDSGNSSSFDVGGHDLTIELPVPQGSAPQTPVYLIDSAITGAYFDPTHEGEGFLIEYLDSSAANIYWFTYDEGGAQRWFTGVAEIAGNELFLPQLLVTEGGIFGPEFDPDTVSLDDAGRFSLVFTGCDTAFVRYGSKTRTFRQNVNRLTNVGTVGCDTVVPRPNDHITGSWYDPTHAGEGFVVEALTDGQALIYWFTYDLDGNQAWYFGTGTLEADGTVEIADLFVTSGAEFGDDFDPDDVELDRWGQASFDFDCDTASMSYQADDPAFGSGTQDLIVLTRVAGVQPCN